MTIRGKAIEAVSVCAVVVAGLQPELFRVAFLSCTLVCHR